MQYFEHIKQLHDCELFHDLKQLACIVLTLCDNCETEVLSLPQRYQCMVYYGNALYHLAEYAKAEDFYKKALLIRKAINKTKGKTTPPTAGQGDMTSDVEVKYKIYLCMIQMKRHKEAITVLEGISTKQRNAKINMALAKLYLRAGMDRSAITSYKEVLRECPMALDAVLGLLSLGQKGADVIALVLNGLPHGTFCDWLSSWIRGHAFCLAQEYTNAITTFKLMDSKSFLKNNIYLMTSVAKVFFLDGLYTQAMIAFQKAHTVDPCHLQHMEIYAYLLARENKAQELQKLSTQLMSTTEHAPEPWLAMGYYSMITKKTVRAVYFAQKANSIDSSHVEAFLLKGAGLLELKRRQEAIFHYRTALRLAPHRFEVYTGLVDCYLLMAGNRARDALSCAGKALKTLGTNSRTLTLYGSVVAQDPTTMSKAKPYLERAMRLDPTNLQPVYILVDILNQEKQYDRGIEILKNRLQTQSTCRLHQMLGDFLTQIGEHQQALDQYSTALHLDPNNTRAREGLERMEKHSDMVIDNSFDVEVEEMENSDNDAIRNFSSDFLKSGEFSMKAGGREMIRNKTGDFCLLMRGSQVDYDASDYESTWSETDFS